MRSTGGELQPFREAPDQRRPWGLTFGSGNHICLGRTLVTGLSNRIDDEAGTNGTMVTLLGALYAAGIALVPDDLPRKAASSFHDSYDTFPVLLTQIEVSRRPPRPGWSPVVATGGRSSAGGRRQRQCSVR